MYSSKYSGQLYYTLYINCRKIKNERKSGESNYPEIMEGGLCFIQTIVIWLKIIKYVGSHVNHTITLQHAIKQHHSVVIDDSRQLLQKNIKKMGKTY